jgi:membrane protein
VPCSRLQTAATTCAPRSRDGFVDFDRETASWKTCCAWGVERNPPFYKDKPRQLAMALSLALLFALSFGITTVLQWAAAIEINGRPVSEILGGDLVAVVLNAPAFLITLVIFLAIYKFVPNVRTPWRDIWPGAMVAAVMFEIAKNLFVWYLQTFGKYDQLYGNIASVVILMIWTYVSAFILIIGAEIASEYGRIKSEDKERR